jgi:hypothetical protein
MSLSWKSCRGVLRLDDRLDLGLWGVDGDTELLGRLERISGAGQRVITPHSGTRTRYSGYFFSFSSIGNIGVGIG